MSINNRRDSNVLGALVVGGMFGLLLGAVSYAVWDVGFPNALIIGGIVAGAAFVVLWLGWREPLPKLGEAQPRAYDPASVTPAPTVGSAGSAGSSTSDNKATVDVTGEVPPTAASDQVHIGATADISAEDEPAPAHEGTKPATMDGPRDGKADDLKQIKGVGPKLEKLVNSMGFYHFDQIANWTDGEVAWVDENLEGFKGRVSRDEWVSQAKILAAGGETEFSKKVEDGGVY